MSVYVDDFKMAGRKAGLKQAWKGIRGPDRLVLDEPTPFGPYLGCEQTRGTITAKEAQQRLQNILPLASPKTAKAQEILMSHSEEEASRRISSIRWEMSGFFEQCLERYEELAKANGVKVAFKPCAHPSIDDRQIPEEEFLAPGKLAKDAAKIVMKILYGCRFVRFDYLWPCGDLARKTTKWTQACDRRMDRLMSHLYSTKRHGLEGFLSVSSTTPLRESS